MLHLRLSALCKKIGSSFSQRQLFLGELLLFVLCAHLMVFGLVIMSSMLSQKKETFSISLAQSGLTYVLMPLSKTVDNSDQINKKRNKSLQTKSKVIDYESYQRQKKEEQRKKRLRAQQSLQTQKVKAKKSPTVAKKSLQQVTAQAQPAERKASLVLRSTAKPTRGKKTSSKKADSAKKKKQSVAHVVTLEITDIEIDGDQPVSQAILEIEQIVKPPVVKQPVEQQPAIEQPVAEQLSIEQQSTEEKQSIDQLVNQDDVSGSDIDLENVVFVGYEQLDNSITGLKIQHEILQHWNPPVGIPPGVSCQLRVHVDGQGKAKQIKITKSSGRLVYDVTARQALSACEFPKEIWNKHNTITLGS